MSLPSILFGDATDAWERWRQALLRTHITPAGLVRSTELVVGRELRVAPEGLRYVRLTGTANPYGGTEVYPSGSGGWTDIPSAPSLGNVYEDNGVSGLTGNVVRVRPGYGPAAGEWRFTFRRQGGGSSGGGRTLTGCPCDQIPDSLAMTMAGSAVTAGNYPSSTTFSWQARPSDLSGYPTSTTDPGYYTPKFTVSSGATVRFYFFCDTVTQYSIAKIVTSDSPLSYPSWVKIANAIVGISGNSCHGYPSETGFMLTNWNKPSGVTSISVS